METVSRELEAVAAALAGLRSASGPVSRVQAVRAAARSMQGLSSTDSQVLARGLIEHGAPAAGDVIARHTGEAVPPEQLVSVAQGLLALDPGEAERFAAELRDPRQRARLAAEGAAAIAAATAGWDPPQARDDMPTRAAPAPETVRSAAGQSSTGHSSTGPSSTPAPPPIPAVTRSRTRPVDEAEPQDDHPPTTPHDQAGTPHAEVVSEAVAPPRTKDQRLLVTELRAATDARSRFALLEDVPRVRGAVEAGGAAELLGAVPDGWQRRTVLRRLLDATGDAAVANEAIADKAIADEAWSVIASFARRGDRFAAASLLQRCGVVPPDGLELVLGHRDIDRLRSRATDRRAVRCV